MAGMGGIREHQQVGEGIITFVGNSMMPPSPDQKILDAIL